MSNITIPGSPRAIQDVVRERERLAFTDTAKVRFRSKLSKEQREALKGRTARPEAFQYRTVDKEPKHVRNRSWAQKWRSWVDLQMPMFDLWAWLEEHFAPDDYLIVDLDFALDIVTESKEEAREIKEYLDARLVKKGRRGHQKVGKCEETSYLAHSKTAGRNIVIYPDRESKVAGEPCCHLEQRYSRADTASRLGIQRASDVIELDHRALWQNYFHLREARKPEKIGKYFLSLGSEKHSRRRRPVIKTYKVGRHTHQYDLDRRVGMSLLRAYAYADEFQEWPKMQMLLDALGMDFKEKLDKVDTEVFLPTMLIQGVTHPEELEQRRARRTTKRRTKKSTRPDD